jgi:mono/diheme cytochrome c family protein
MQAAKLGVILLFVLSIVVACSSGTQLTANNGSNANANVKANSNEMASAATPVQLPSGKEVYATSCQKCHQENGKGGKVTVDGKNLDVDDLTNAPMKKKDDAKIAKLILDGAPDDGMPAFVGKLSTDELNSVIKHIRTLQGQ